MNQQRGGLRHVVATDSRERPSGRACWPWGSIATNRQRSSSAIKRTWLDAAAKRGSADRCPETRGKLPDTPCSAPCYSLRRKLKQPAELFGTCRSEKSKDRAQIADLPVFLPVTRERPMRRPVSRDCVHHQEVGASGPGFPFLQSLDNLA